MKKITFYVIMTFLTMSGIAQTVTIPNPGNYPVPAALADADNAKLGALIPRTMNLLHFYLDQRRLSPGRGIPPLWI